MKIGIDLDDVIVDFFPSFLEFYNQRYEVNFKMSDMTSFHIWEVGIGKTKNEAIRFIDEFYDSNNYDIMPFVDGAKEGLDELLEKNKISIITSRFFRYGPKTKNFVRKYFSNRNISLWFTSDFGQNGYSKAEVCEKLEVEVYVEDCFDYALSCADRGIKTLLLRKPWNEVQWKKLKGDEIMIPVENWEEVLDRIRRNEES